MKKNIASFKYFIVILLFIGVIFGIIFLCQSYFGTNNINSLSSRNVSLKDILLNYNAYVNSGQALILEGKNGGWGAVECNSHGVKLGMITRSDTLIYDNTGCMYVEGGLYPGVDQKFLNKSVKIEAKVVLDDNKNPLLEVEKIIYKEE